MKIANFLMATGVATALVAPLRAELPPQVYMDLQKKAEEVMEIRADEVISKPKGLLDRSSYTETVKATVIEVTRSRSGVKKGDVITIIYQRQGLTDGRVGPSPAPQLKQGAQYPAFLVKGEDGNFSVAARGMSFSKMEK